MNTYVVNIVDWQSHESTLSTIRDVVFIDEQNVPEELERDPMDVNYIHALATTIDGTPIGTGRLISEGKIGRMAVLKEWRGKGIGREILSALVKAATEQGYDEVSLDAQIHAQDFYQRQGFVAYGDEFMDAGIPHIKMKKEL